MPRFVLSPLPISARSIATAALVAFVAGCTSKPEIIRNSSAPNPPRWTQTLPQDQRYLYFVGAKSGAPSLEDGRSAALASALSQASQFIGVQVTANETVVDSTRAHESMVRSDVTAKAGGEVRSAELADSYHESLSRIVGATQFDRFDVWVLVRFPREEADRERARQEEARRAEAKLAQARYEEARDASSRGDFRLAVRLLSEADQRLVPLKGQQISLDGPHSTVADLSATVSRALKDAIAERRRTAVVYSERALGTPSRTPVSAGRIAEILTGQGFVVLAPQRGNVSNEASAIEAARGAGARIALLVSADATRTGTVFGTQASCTANVTVRALDVATGAVLAQADKQARGIRGDAGIAASEALREAAEAAADELAKALIAREI